MATQLQRFIDVQKSGPVIANNVVYGISTLLSYFRRLQFTEQNKSLIRICLIIFPDPDIIFHLHDSLSDQNAKTHTMSHRNFHLA